MNYRPKIRFRAATELGLSIPEIWLGAVTNDKLARLDSWCGIPSLWAKFYMNPPLAYLYVVCTPCGHAVS